MNRMLFSALIQIIKTILWINEFNPTRGYGLQVGSFSPDISLSHIILTVDPTKEVIHEAIKQNSHIIIALNSLFPSSLMQVQDNHLDRIILLGINNIRLLTLGSISDFHQNGLGFYIIKCCGLDYLELYPNTQNSKTPIGLICKSSQESCSLNQLITNVKRHLSLQSVYMSGTLENSINHVLIIPRGTISDENLIDIRQKGINTILMTDLDYSFIYICRNFGFNTIFIPRYGIESMVISYLQKTLALEFPRDSFSVIDSSNPLLLV